MKIDLDTKGMLIVIGLAVVALGAMVLAGHAWGKRSVIKEYITSPTVEIPVLGEVIKVDRWHTKPVPVLVVDEKELQRRLDSAMATFEDMYDFVSTHMKPFGFETFTARQDRWLVSEDGLDSVLLSFRGDLIRAEAYPLDRSGSLSADYGIIDARWKRKRLPDSETKQYWLSWYFASQFSYYHVRPKADEIHYMADINGYWYQGIAKGQQRTQWKLDTDAGLKIKIENIRLKLGIFTDLADNTLYFGGRVGVEYESGIF